MLCGRYEGIDERVVDALVTDEVSIGDYVLTGGELPALVLLDAVARLVPGVVGDAASVEADSFARGVLDHPHYTRPAVCRGRRGARGADVGQPRGDRALAAAGAARAHAAAAAENCWTTARLDAPRSATNCETIAVRVNRTTKRSTS